jgi:hypothetical protein
MGALTLNEYTMSTDSRNRKGRALKHALAFALMIIALLLAGKFNVRIPAAAWTGPAIVILLFLYAVWILLWLGPMRQMIWGRRKEG